MNLATFVSAWPGRIAILTLVLAIGGGATLVMRGNQPQASAAPRTATVTRGSITQTVSISGSVNAQGQARLAFKTGGRIANLMVSVGQTVNAGQVLAQLDTTDLQTAMTNAQQQLANAQASYDKQLLSAQQAQRSLDQARQTAVTDLANAQASLNKLKANYASAKTNFASYGDSALAGISAFQSSLDTMQTQVDAIIAEMRTVVGGGDTGDLRNALNAITNANSPALQNAHSNSVTLLSPAIADYQNARTAVQQATTDYDTAYTAGNDTTAQWSSWQAAQANYTLAASRLSSAVDTTASILASLSTAVTTAQASLNTQQTRDLHNPFDKWRADLSTLYGVVTFQQQSVSTAKLKLTQAGSSLSTFNDIIGGSLATAAQNIVTTQQRDQQSIENAQNSVANTPFNLQSAQSSIDTANNGVATAQTNLDAALLTAPSSGVVASIANQVGEYVSGGGNSNSAFIVLTNTNALVLHGTVGEADISKLKLGQVSNITIDALSGSKMTGRVTSLDPVATISQGVPVYGVDIAIDVPASTVKAGMSGTASVILASKQNVLIVPNTAIRTVNGQRGVTVLKDGESVDTVATFGIANDTSTEVVSGLSEGDVIVIPQARASASNNANGGRGVQIGGPGQGFPGR